MAKRITHYYDGTTIEEDFDLNLTWDDIRVRRDADLSASDNWMLPDRGLTTAQYDEAVAWREALRNITNDYATPDLAFENYPDPPSWGFPVPPLDI